MSDSQVALVAGAFALVGVLLGGAVNSFTAWRQRVAEDKRRWLADRKTLYARYLGLVASMLQEIDSVAVFMRYDDAGTSKPDPKDLAMIDEGVFEFQQRWDSEIQPALGEVQLLASARVADLADRASGALLALTVYVNMTETFTAYYPTWFQALDLSKVLRNEMRIELGLEQLADDSFPRDSDWPWLADRPPAESYVQNHGRRS